MRCGACNTEIPDAWYLQKHGCPTCYARQHRYRTIPAKAGSYCLACGAGETSLMRQRLDYICMSCGVGFTAFQAEAHAHASNKTGVIWLWNGKELQLLKVPVPVTEEE